MYGTVQRVINEEYIIKKLNSKSKIDEEEYIKALNAISKYDNCHILCDWFKEIVSIGGDNYLEKQENLKYIIKELEQYRDSNTYLKKFYKFVKNNAESLIMFVEDYYYRMHVLAICRTAL